MGSNYTKNAFSAVRRSHSPLGVTTLPNPIAGLEEPLRGVKKRRKGGERKERQGMKGTGENTLPNKLLVTALAAAAAAQCTLG